MSSGCFPVSEEHDSWGRELSDASLLITRVINKYYDKKFVNAKPEDYINDGAYLGNLRQALDLIRGCLK